MRSLRLLYRGTSFSLTLLVSVGTATALVCVALAGLALAVGLVVALSTYFLVVLCGVVLMVVLYSIGWIVQDNFDRQDAASKSVASE